METMSRLTGQMADAVEEVLALRGKGPLSGRARRHMEDDFSGVLAAELVPSRHEGPRIYPLAESDSREIKPGLMDALLDCVDPCLREAQDREELKEELTGVIWSWIMLDRFGDGFSPYVAEKDEPETTDTDM